MDSQLRMCKQPQTWRQVEQHHQQRPIVFLVAALLFLPLAAPTAQAVTTIVSVTKRPATGVADGGRCYLDKDRKHMQPYCAGNMLNCVVVAVPNRAIQVFSGICNSSYTKGSFCKFQNIPYAVGTKAIVGNSLCASCDCEERPNLKGDKNKGVCDCSPLPPCYVDYDGKAVGRFACPKPQDMCIINKPGGGGLDGRGLPIDEGRCIYSGIGSICTSAGRGWGPKFYSEGVVGMPASANRCMTCMCNTNGLPTACRYVQNCTVQ